MILLDTSFLIALKNRADMHFARAQEIQQELFAKKYGSLFLTDYIFDEFMTFLRVRLKNQEEALFLGEHLLQDKDLSLIGISKVDFQEAWEVFKKYKHLSFTDATTLVIMKRYSITHLCSFDSDFDTFRKIERVH